MQVSDVPPLHVTWDLQLMSLLREINPPHRLGANILHPSQINTNIFSFSRRHRGETDCHRDTYGKYDHYKSQTRACLLRETPWHSWSCKSLASTFDLPHNQSFSLLYSNSERQKQTMTYPILILRSAKSLLPSCIPFYQQSPSCSRIRMHLVNLWNGHRVRSNICYIVFIAVGSSAQVYAV